MEMGMCVFACRERKRGRNKIKKGVGFWVFIYARGGGIFVLVVVESFLFSSSFLCVFCFLIPVNNKNILELICVLINDFEYVCFVLIWCI